MTVTNGYCSLLQLRDVNGALNSTDKALDAQFEAAIAAASRQIDAMCGRRFWQDGSVVARTFWPENAWECCTDDISTVTGLIVKVDTGDNGFTSGSTTLTINTDFIVTPPNAGAEVPVWPYTGLRLVSGNATALNVASYGKPSVQVTAKFGWPAVPDDIARACVIQAQRIYKAPDAGDIELSGVAAALCERYVKQQ